jgi:hypothetical protein
VLLGTGIEKKIKAPKEKKVGMNGEFKFNRPGNAIINFNDIQKKKCERMQILTPTGRLIFRNAWNDKEKKKKKINSSKMEGNKRERGAATTGELNE